MRKLVVAGHLDRPRAGLQPQRQVGVESANAVVGPNLIRPRREPSPTLTVALDELVDIARSISATGQGVLKLVSDFVDVDAEFELCRQMALASGRPLSFTLAQVRGHTWRRQLALLSEANDEGRIMRGQVAPRAAGLLLGLQCTLNPFMGNAVYREIAGLPLHERVAIMRDPAFKAKLLEAVAATDRPRGLEDMTVVYELGDPPNYEPDPSHSIARRAEAIHRAPLELAYDLMLEGDGRAFLYLPLLNYNDGNLDSTREMLVHPRTVVGLSDGGAHVGTICDASFPTTVLSHWGRDRPTGRIDVPFLVHRQTHATALAVGLLDRGVLAPGYRADINVIDLPALRNRPPTMHYDLPAGGKRLLQGADGYVATMVAGTITYEHGEAAGPLPGRLIRGPQPAPGAANGVT